MGELPSGTVTFLFTDLEGSTRQWEQHPEAMRPALERHDSLLRDAVERHRGRIVKTTGDGLHAVFVSTRDALDAALAAQRALAAETWSVPGGLRVRMGLHTGDAAARDGDYYGPATNRAARVMAAAHGEQVVVSHATEEIVRDTLPDEVALLDLGEHRLPDLARPERIFQVVAIGLRRDFPPLRSLDAMPGNLPGQLTSFVGRAVEREAIADALLASRLVTVTGVGGVGKSRIAIQVALDIAPRFADGTWLCELATAADAEELAQVVAATLGVLPRPASTLAASVIDALRLRELVLVLDNCEHLVAAVGRLTEGLLQECPGVRILATSREALGVAGEQVWPLTSLELPARTASPDVIGASEAVQLFTERARAVQPGFVLDESNAAAVAEICRRLDGIPLAVELAAARVTIMTPADIAARLDQRFQLLTGGRRSAAERHQTLRAAIEWSYEMLDERERTLFERLGVFPGSFDAEAVAAVAASEGLQAWDVLDAGAGLVAKSMIMADEASGTTRYQMLETLRAFAASAWKRAVGSTRCSDATRSITPASRRRPTPASPVPMRSSGASACTSSSTTCAPPSSAASCSTRTMTCETPCASSPRSRSRRSTTGDWASARGRNTSCSTSCGTSTSLHPQCAPRCWRPRHSAPRVATTSTRCGSSRPRHSATGSHRTARARCGRTSPSPPTRG